MRGATRTAATAMLIAGLFVGSPSQAETAVPSATNDAPAMMQEGGDMQGMEGMTGMMEQMNKMMGLCTKMMEGMMTETETEKGSEPAKTP